MKKCSKCKIEKQLSDFGMNRLQKDGLQHYCRACKSIRDKQYGEKNRDAILAQRAEYRELNREKLRERAALVAPGRVDRKREIDRQSRERNRDSLLERKRVFHHKNKEKISSVAREYYKRNRDSLMEKARMQYAGNKDAYKDNAKNRRARSRGADGKFIKADIDRLFELQRGLCANCKVDIAGSYHIDHIMPLIKGGSNWPENLQLLCPPCNLSKHAKDPFDWARQNGRLL